ncbi:MAG: lipoprotein signal peptidase [Epsilonproteobacteria bacterium]|nr:lipoprotein signal peptidase [Campylobacterota bacterium]NPA63557.1 lipoprotein signal peptidase [Campylobacterota bacterium]
MRGRIAFLSMALGVFLIDRALKELFFAGFYWESACITLGFVLNKGVAFSLFAFLGEWLKWILVGLIAFVLGYALKERIIDRHPLLSGMLFGAALGNLYDRFVYGGVIDYVYWHCGFDFAVFNFADVMIDLAVAGFIYLHFFKKDV